MLNKLLENLPFNPSLIDQVTFYGRRLRAESSIRRTGFIFVTLALVVQVIAVTSPPKPTLASSPNDLITGGISSMQDALTACQNNTASYGNILSNYNISCNDIAHSTTVSLRSTDYNKQLFSMGRLDYTKPGETPVAITGSTYYWRYLWGWDTYAYSTYQALKLTSDSGKTFFILYSCGNLVSIGLPSTPVLQVSKTTTPGYPASGASVKPGDQLSYRIYFSNSGGDAAQQVNVVDPLPAHTTYLWIGSGNANNFAFTNGASNWTWSSMPAGDQNWYVDYRVQVNSDTPPGTQICNTATIQSSTTSPLTTNAVCNAVATTPVQPLSVTPPTPQRPTVAACPYYPNLAATSPDCKPCTNSQSQEDKLACLSFSKSATNVTEHIDNANGTTAQAGDVITYTLTVKNNGKANFPNYDKIQDDLSNVLTYANMQDLNGAKLDASTNTIIWPPQTIPASGTIQKQFTVVVKNPIPAISPSASDPGHFDHALYNTYGNSITINLPMPVVQTATQIVSTTLPNTGPGSSLFIAIAVTMVVGYFFARSRLLAKEVAITRANFTGEGVR